MSYIVTIHRDPPITEQELVTAVRGDNHFSIAKTDDLPGVSIVLRWREDGGAPTEYFTLNRGAIDITTPSGAAMEAVQSLASALGAEISGEDGENLTDVGISDGGAVGCGPFVWAILGIGALLALYWALD